MNSRELLQNLQAGDGQAATEIFDRYVGRLVALAQSRIGGRLRRRIDGDDIAQSALRSFFVHARNNEYVHARSGDLWRLLASIAIHKLHGQIERQTAARRAIQREDGAGAALIGNALPAGEPTADEVLAAIEQWDLATDRMSEFDQSVLAARLRGDSVETIAAVSGKSTRTVRRALLLARRTLELTLLGSDESALRHGDLFESGDDDGKVAPLVQLAYGDYTLERLLGAGGMGKVYRAVERSTGEIVAMKALQKARQSDRRAVERFIEESRVLARLNHPNIVRLQGIGRFPGGGFFLVMDFVDGADLQVRLERGPLAAAEAVRIVIAAAEAIGYAHSQSIVHGDVKPANVMIDGTGRVVVTDFGLAQFIVDRVGKSGLRRVMGGTEGYMAPEVRLPGATPTPAADIYGLGALLWALVTGRRPGLKTTSEPAVGGDSTARVLRTCLADDPNQRYPTAAALMAALRQI